MSSGFTDRGALSETNSFSLLRAFWRASSRIPVMSSGAVDQLKLSEIGITGATCRSEEHTSELQSLTNLVCRLLLEKKKNINTQQTKQHHLITDKMKHTK